MENLATPAIATLSEEEKKAKWLKTARWIYWINTGFFGSTMFIAGVIYFIEAPWLVANNLNLGYPIYIYKILGTAKILGSIAILWGRFAVLKEWAYVGYSLTLMIAAASHIFSGDSTRLILTPLILLLLVLISYRQWKTGWM